MCGENEACTRARECQGGSPPRVRGKRLDEPHQGRFVRLTPACAGKTMRGRPAAVRVPAHPRVCGENIARVMRLMGGYGSPPRVRGKRPRRRHAQRRRGLTPACAGKTSPPGPRSGRSAAHPRVCGENPTPSSSPPPTPWLTPACAGKTPDGAPPPPPSSAHPRVCGENFSFNVQCVGEHGSPPRVRGKRELSGTRWIYSGLTPACAGKTGSTSSRSAPTCGPRAHPRVCGENEVGVKVTADLEGSPPRVRGKLFDKIVD